MSDEELLIGDAGIDSSFVDRPHRRDTADSASGSSILMQVRTSDKRVKQGGLESS
ncbi:unnamed protein product [Toxocara canis]|uniref:Uncharacterized protein n=1 Tax=Toxocara canis TaxID=6265 RepID=A0A183U819_TOXCA|nr:unnamed protein product [Toxocara canis]